MLVLGQQIHLVTDRVIYIKCVTPILANIHNFNLMQYQPLSPVLCNRLYLDANRTLESCRDAASTDKKAQRWRQE